MLHNAVAKKASNNLPHLNDATSVAELEKGSAAWLAEYKAHPEKYELHKSEVNLPGVDVLTLYRFHK